MLLYADYYACVAMPRAACFQLLRVFLAIATLMRRYDGARRRFAMPDAADAPLLLTFTPALFSVYLFHAPRRQDI